MTHPNEPVSDFERDTLPWLADVRRYAYRLTGSAADADDLTQITFLNAFRGWHTFRPGSDVRRWLFAIARNAHFRNRPRREKLVATEDAELESLAAATDSGRASEALEALERIDLAAGIDAEIARLADAYREAVLMVDVEGLSYEEAAAQAGVPVGTIRSRLYRARRQLQQALIARAEDAGLIGGKE
ncbi:MAG: sigma-70 family RNA polymerase sigma factor [Gemmatimonadetes bacterium]|nr:sigma-70 family RNA polymerase sigma factor [Gemmatimonadota bacterium]